MAIAMDLKVQFYEVDDTVRQQMECYDLEKYIKSFSILAMEFVCKEETMTHNSDYQLMIGLNNGFLLLLKNGSKNIEYHFNLTLQSEL